MQIPMDILSQMITRTDFGADTRQKKPAATKSNREFGNVLQESRKDVGNEKLKESNVNKDTRPTDKDKKPLATVKPETPDKLKDNAGENETLAAEAMGYQNAVVFILEGDKESATTPEIAVDSIQATDTTTITEPVATAETEKDEVYTQPPEQTVTDANTEPNQSVANAGNAANAAVGADTKTAADVKASDDIKKAVIAETAGENDSEAGEVTARMPAIRTSEQQENKDNDTGFSKNGDLSPLENENDSKPVEGRKEKTYSEAEKTAKIESGGAQEPINNALPITESIKPERFQANQQMKQAADTPVRTENLFDEMVSRIETMNSESQQSVTIQLKPEVMGKLALEIAMDAAGLHVKISAANNDVRTMINGQINALIESLENKGIEVVEVEVAYTGLDNGAFKDSNNNQTQSGHPKRHHHVDGIEDSASYYAVLPSDMLDYYLDEELSSVEYRA